ncbi:MAG TPA: lysylphosphatidylglycerol synthase domain-containing protein, partial [Dehalococcoidia bacterium]|nr:lysylphosphatidylglycerol synthase domain-containing protein [Dehalococcoidia bacterium]
GLLLCGAALFGFLVTLIIVRNPQLTHRVLGWRWPLLNDRWRTRFTGWSESVVVGLSVLTSGSRFRTAMILTVGAWVLEFGMYWLIAEAFSIHEGFLTIAFAGAAANLALSLPSAQGGLGAFQLVAKEALLKFGLPVSTVAAYAVALHVLLVGPVTLVGLGVFWVMVPARRRTEMIESTLET